MPTRIDVEVGASYDAPPNMVTQAPPRSARQRAVGARDPAPDVIFNEFGVVGDRLPGAVLDRRLRPRPHARDQVRTNIWYTFKRHGIEIP